MISVGYHNTGAYRLFNLINSNIMVSIEIVVDEKNAWNWESNDTTHKPMMINILYEESSEQDETLVNEPHLNEITIVEAYNHEHGNEVVQQDMVAIRQRPQRTRIAPARLQDCEVVGHDEVTTDGDLVNFSLLAGYEPINYNEA